MSRMQVELREATTNDALFLVQLWQGSLRRCDVQEQVADVESIIQTAEHSPDLVVLIAEYDGQQAGAVYLRRTTMSPINLEPTLQMFSLTVAAPFRRKGVGHALLEAAAAFAEQAGASLFATAAASGSRDGNRFLARLGFAPNATWRVAPVSTVRTRVAPLVPISQRRPVSRTSLVLAARRSMRRAQVEA